MKRRMRPVTHLIDQPVFHRIPVQVIDMRGEIGIVADLMLPESALPEADFAGVELASRQARSIDEMCAGFGGRTFDERPSS